MNPTSDPGRLRVDPGPRLIRSIWYRLRVVPGSIPGRSRVDPDWPAVDPAEPASKVSRARVDPSTRFARIDRRPIPCRFRFELGSIPHRPGSIGGRPGQAGIDFGSTPGRPRNAPGWQRIDPNQPVVDPVHLGSTPRRSRVDPWSIRIDRRSTQDRLRVDCGSIAGRPVSSGSAGCRPGRPCIDCELSRCVAARKSCDSTPLGLGGCTSHLPCGIGCVDEGVGALRPTVHFPSCAH